MRTPRSIFKSILRVCASIVPYGCIPYFITDGRMWFQTTHSSDLVLVVILVVMVTVIRLSDKVKEAACHESEVLAS